MSILYKANRILLAAYLAGFFVYAMSYIGEPPRSCSPATWDFPLKLLALFGSFAWLGWFAAKEHSREGK